MKSINTENPNKELPSDPQENLQVLRAGLPDLQDLAPLFDAYRVFYGQPPDLPGAKKFLQDRIRNRESIIFIARIRGVATGFTQLYPAFSSVSLQPLYILNDLYVKPDYRQARMGEKLLRAAQEFCKANAGKGLALETAVDNPAQRLYERLGWKKDSHCFHYFWKAE